MPAENLRPQKVPPFLNIEDITRWVDWIAEDDGTLKLSWWDRLCVWVRVRLPVRPEHKETE